MKYLGDIAEDATVTFGWSTNNRDGASITRATDGTVKIRRSGGTEIAAGITDNKDTPDTGLHECIIDTSAHVNYQPGYDYEVWLDGAVIDGQTVNAVLATFSIENRSDAKASKVIVNKAVQTKSTGAVVYYDNDGATPLLTHTPTDGESTITRTPS